MERDSDGYMELLAEVSPNGNITAIVEQDDRVAYLYLHGHPDTDFGIRSCWIRNLKKAPKALNTRGIRKGIAPMLGGDNYISPARCLS